MIYNFHRTVLFQEGKFLKIHYSIFNNGNDAINLVKGYKSPSQEYIEPEGTTKDILKGAERYQIHVDDVNIEGSLRDYIEIEFSVSYLQDEINKVSKCKIIVVLYENVFLIKEIINVLPQKIRFSLQNRNV